MRIVSILCTAVVFMFCFLWAFNLPAKALGGFDDEEEVVRGFLWGASAQDVSRFERSKFLKLEDGNLFYSEKMYDRDTTIGYQFANDRLIRVRIDIHGRTPDPKDWITLLMDTKKDLDKKWGKPLSEDFIWYDEKEKDYPDNWGLAVLTGDLAINAIWGDEETKVNTTLKALGELRPVLTILYEKRAFRPKSVDEVIVPEDVIGEVADDDVLNDIPAKEIPKESSDNTDDLLFLP